MTVLTPHNSLRTFALVCVAVSSVFIMGVAGVLIHLLQSDWCGRAIEAGVETKAARPEYAIGACFNLLTQQVSALAWALHIALGVLALSLFVLIVIVIAGARAEFNLSKDGLSGKVAREAAEAAQATADGAQHVADEIEAETKP